MISIASHKRKKKYAVVLITAGRSPDLALRSINSLVNPSSCSSSSYVKAWKCNRFDHVLQRHSLLLPCRWVNWGLFSSPSGCCDVNGRAQVIRDKKDTYWPCNRSRTGTTSQSLSPSGVLPRGVFHGSSPGVPTLNLVPSMTASDVHIADILHMNQVSGLHETCQPSVYVSLRSPEGLGNLS